MSLPRFASILVVLVSACADDPTTPPAAPVAVPIDPVGRFIVTSAFSLPAPPPGAADVLGELTAATDGPDDPSRYLIDLMIERLPPGSTKTYATAISPYVAAYVNQRIAAIAPGFVDGSRALSAGLLRIAQRFGTSETLDLAIATGVDGGSSLALRRTITGLRFDRRSGRELVEVRFAPEGLADVTITSRVRLDGDRLTIERHPGALPYTALLRLGLDQAVIPDVVPGAHDLAQALVALVDCGQLGGAVSEYIGVGSPAFYASACSVGLTALAARIYEHIDAIEPAVLSLELAGDARAVDANHDGPMDAIASGAWTGTFAGLAVTGLFEGTSQ